jgi:hypothetical protein
MSAPKFGYRIWQRGADWHWQVTVDDTHMTHGGSYVRASGVASNSAEARSAAFSYVLQRQGGTPNSQ